MTTLASIQLQVSANDFLRVMSRWGLTESQQREILGGVAPDTYAHYAGLSPLDAGHSLHALVAAVTEIDRAIAQKLGDPAIVKRWLWMSNAEHPFDGAPPLALMLRDRAGLAIVANYLKCEAR